MSDRYQIDEIKSKLDIAQIILQYVPSLKHTGRNYFGLCPFHKEKSPSFSVNSELGVYKCFGCGEGGDVIKFIEKIEGVDFQKALEIAAAKAGVVLKKNDNPEYAKNKAEKEKLLQVNKLAAEFYNYILNKHISGGPGRAYIEKRKILQTQIDSFQIGYAPKAYENLKLFLVKKGFALPDLVRWGLLVEKNNKIYDKFRERLLFPVHNAYGEVVGFSGRKIVDDDMGPKYLNSPETIVYRKSQLLFGLYQAKETVRKENFSLLVEGNIDVVSSHKAGISNIVAPLGTAITQDQIKLIRRYTDKIYFAFDKDSAGIKALIKAFEFSAKEGFEMYVVDFGEYKDIDEMITKGGNWKGVVDEPIDAMKYLIKIIAQNYNLENTIQKSKYIREIVGKINLFADEIVRLEYLTLLSQRYSIPMDVLFSESKKVGETANMSVRYTAMNNEDSTTKANQDVKSSIENVTIHDTKQQFSTYPQQNIGGDSREKNDVLFELSKEFISIILHSKFNIPDSELLPILGSGTVYKIYNHLILGKDLDQNIKLRFQNFINEIQLNSLSAITNEKLLAAVVKNLGKRIKTLRAKRIIDKIKRESDLFEDDASALQNVKESTKLLQSDKSPVDKPVQRS